MKSKENDTVYKTDGEYLDAIRQMPVNEACIAISDLFWTVDSEYSQKFIEVFAEKQQCLKTEADKVSLAVALYKHYKSTNNRFSQHFALYLMNNL